MKQIYQLSVAVEIVLFSILSWNPLSLWVQLELQLKSVQHF